MKTFMSQKLRDATKRIAPVWPLDRFVAVNPYLGLVEEPFEDAAARLRRVAGARSTMKLSRDDIDVRDLEEVLAERQSRLSAERVLGLLDQEREASMVSTFNEVLDDVTGKPWSRFVREHLGAWFATYFDEDYAAWQPDRADSLFATWKAEAEVDRTPEIKGAADFRKAVRALPDSFEEAACEALARLDVPRPGLELYLHRLLMSVGGWSANAARVVWDRRLYDGAEDDTLVELLAVLLVFEAALHESFGDGPALLRWRVACGETSRIASVTAPDAVEEARVLAQLAFEKKFQRRLEADFEAAAEHAPRKKKRPTVQAAFCIDVRSEVYRRHLEAVDSAIDTIGFAGFFGFGVEYVPIGHEHGGKQCPVLLKPSHRVSETGATAPVVERQLLKRAWHSFKMGAISCFSFVGPIGLAYLPKLFTDAYGMTRPVARPRNERAIDLERAIPLEERIELAAGALARPDHVRTRRGREGGGQDAQHALAGRAARGVGEPRGGLGTVLPRPRTDDRRGREARRSAGGPARGARGLRVAAQGPAGGVRGTREVPVNGCVRAQLRSDAPPLPSGEHWAPTVFHTGSRGHRRRRCPLPTPLEEDPAFPGGRIRGGNTVGAQLWSGAEPLGTGSPSPYLCRQVSVASQAAPWRRPSFAARSLQSRAARSGARGPSILSATASRSSA